MAGQVYESEVPELRDDDSSAPEGHELGLDASTAFGGSSRGTPRMYRENDTRMHNTSVSSPATNNSPRARYVPSVNAAGGPYATSSASLAIDAPHRGAQTLSMEPVQAPVPSYVPQPPAVYDPDSIVDSSLRRSSASNYHVGSPASPRAQAPRNELQAPAPYQPQPAAIHSPDAFARPSAGEPTPTRPPPLDVTRSPQTPQARQQSPRRGDSSSRLITAEGRPVDSPKARTKQAQPATPSSLNRSASDFRGSASLPLQHLEVDNQSPYAPRPVAYAPAPAPSPAPAPAPADETRPSTSTPKKRRRGSRSNLVLEPLPSDQSAYDEQGQQLYRPEEVFVAPPPSEEPHGRLERVLKVTEKTVDAGQIPGPPQYIHPGHPEYHTIQGHAQSPPRHYTPQYPVDQRFASPTRAIYVSPAPVVSPQPATVSPPAVIRPPAHVLVPLNTSPQRQIIYAAPPPVVYGGPAVYAPVVYHAPPMAYAPPPTVINPAQIVATRVAQPGFATPIGPGVYGLS